MITIMKVPIYYHGAGIIQVDAPRQGKIIRVAYEGTLLNIWYLVEWSLGSSVIMDKTEYRIVEDQWVLPDEEGVENEYLATYNAISLYSGDQRVLHLFRVIRKKVSGEVG